MNKQIYTLSSFPSSIILENWQNYLAYSKGLYFELPIIRLAIFNTIESWTYLNLEQSLNMFKNHKGEWLPVLSQQVTADLFSECLIIKFN